MSIEATADAVVVAWRELLPLSAQNTIGPGAQFALSRMIATALRAQQPALEAARHELTTLHGLYAADHTPPRIDDVFQVDTRATLAMIDAVLDVPTIQQP